MADTSDALPSGGFFLPAFPPSWVGNAPNLTAVTGVMDQTMDAARQKIGALRLAHIISGATDSDLDALAMLFGLGRTPNETDAQLRARIPASASSGINASTDPDMASNLTTSLGVPVTVVDGPVGSATFTVTVTRNIPNLGSVPAMVRKLKAAGTIGSVYASVSVPTVSGTSGTYPDNRAGDFRAADQSTAGTGANIYVGS